MKNDLSIPTMVLFCHGTDDYSLWSVELPAEIIQDVKQGQLTAEGALDAVMDRVPDMRVCGENRLSLLFHQEGGFHLYVKEVNGALLETYRGDGWSVRGSRSSVMTEIQELVQDQNRDGEEEYT